MTSHSLPDVASQLAWESVHVCPLCGGTNLSRWRSRCRDSTGLPGQLTYRRCRTCDCRVLDPRPTSGSVHLLYGAAYAPYVKQPDGVDLSTVGRSGEPTPLLRRLAELYETNEMTRRVLDFGCGTANFVNAARAVGWQTVAADFTQSGIAGADRDGHETRLVDEQFWAWFKDSQFDVIRLSHVIEHLYDPAGTLERLLGGLKPGGVLHVITPDPCGPATTLMRRRSNHYQFVHVTLMPSPSLAQAAARIGASSTFVFSEATTKDLWRSWLLATGRATSYENAPPQPSGRVPGKILRFVGRAFDRVGRHDRYHAFITR